MFSNPKLNRLLSAAVVCALCFSTLNVNAQLSQNPDKFLGNITTRYQVDPGGGVPAYYTLWNQITPENESKWGSVEGTRGSYNWGSDTPFNYAKNHNFTYKFHALVWGAQYPNWFTSSLPVKERYNAIVNWFDKVKEHYSELPMIDVVNEAVGNHQAGNPLMKESLGGGGKTGYDWLINAFELAHERWPDAILIYNDFNTFQWDTDAYIDLVRTLRDAGAPIDAYGCQSHDVDNISKTNLQNSMSKIQNAVKMPMYITELDVNLENDTAQMNQYMSIFPVMWEADYCAGVTIWGHVYGATWVDHSGLYKNGVERLAMTWLKQYMATDKAKNAKSPFPGMKKQISLYIKPSTIAATRGDTLNITVRAQLVDSIKINGLVKDTIRIDSIKLFVKGVLDTIMTNEPYIAKYVPTVNGRHDLRAVVYTSDHKTYERYGGFTAYNPRSTYGASPISLPGVLQAEEYDKGGDGVTFHDNDESNRGNANFRTSEGVDIENCSGGRAIGYTSTDEWLEYTVDVAKSGYYYYNAIASSGANGSSFKLSLNTDNGLVDITSNISVTMVTENDWSKYRSFTGKTLIPLEQGQHIIRLTITGNNCNIDKITFDHIQIDETLDLKITSTPAPTAANHKTTLHFNTIDPERENAISSVRVYINNTLSATLKSKPFDFDYKPNKEGTFNISAVAIDTLKHESNLCSYALKVLQGRTAYKSITLPATVQAEDFDRCLDGITYHDSDTIDEGETRYRTDNQGVDIIRIEDKGYAIGYTAKDEWLEYTLNFNKDGYYFIKPRVCFETDTASFRIGLMNDGVETPLATVSFPEDCELNTYEILPPISFTENINKGQNTIRITITSPGCNIDNFQIRFDKPTDVKYITNDDNYANGTRYNLGGAIVGEDYKGIVIINGKKVLQK